MEEGHASSPIATKSLTSISILDRAGEKNSTLSRIPFGSSIMANLKSLGSGNRGTLPPMEKCKKCYYKRSKQR